jgi:methionine-S-sulfoxide reductase
MGEEMKKIETIYLGGGCFWCTEAIFRRIEGVVSVIPGYAGGTKNNPTYEEVCSGETGHAEVIKIEYELETLPVEILLDLFFKTHDPTTLNRQGADVGTQYRSVIYFTSQQQEMAALNIINELNKTTFNHSIVTAVEPFSNYFAAEQYHHDYYSRNKNQPYCQFTITPKIEKLGKLFDK